MQEEKDTAVATMHSAVNAVIVITCAIALCDAHGGSMDLMIELNTAEKTQFWRGVNTDNDGSRLKNLAASPSLASFPTNTVLDVLQTNATNLSPYFQGMWWWKGHPGFGKQVDLKLWLLTCVERLHDCQLFRWRRTVQGE